MNVSRLKEDLQVHLKAAKAICDAVENDQRDFTVAERSQLEQLLEKAKGCRAQIKQAEDDEEIRGIVSKMAGGSLPDSRRHDSWSKAYFAAVERSGAKALISPSGSVGVPDPLTVLAPLGERAETMLQFIPQETIGSDAFSFLRETVRTHAATVVAASATKPTSTYTVAKVDDTVKTIAHLSEPIPRSYLADAPLLGRYLDTVLREGLELGIEDEIVAGDGTGAHFEGIEGTAGVLGQAYDTDMLTTCRKAITTLELQSITPDGWVLHPSDWETLELTTSANHYVMGQGQGQSTVPVDRARRRLWGLPVALSLAVSQGEAILADWARSTCLYVRDQARIDWSENVYDSGSGATDFERNLIRYRAEGRWGFAVLRPSGVVIVELALGS